MGAVFKQIAETYIYVYQFNSFSLSFSVEYSKSASFAIFPSSFIPGSVLVVQWSRDWIVWVDKVKKSSIQISSTYGQQIWETVSINTLNLNVQVKSPLETSDIRKESCIYQSSNSAINSNIMQLNQLIDKIIQGWF